MSSRHLLCPNFSLVSLNLSGFVNKNPLPHAASKSSGIELIFQRANAERSSAQESTESFTAREIRHFIAQGNPVTAPLDKTDFGVEGFSPNTVIRIISPSIGFLSVVNNTFP